MCQQKILGLAFSNLYNYDVLAQKSFSLVPITSLSLTAHLHSCNLNFLKTISKKLSMPIKQVIDRMQKPNYKESTSLAWAISQEFICAVMYMKK